MATTTRRRRSVWTVLIGAGIGVAGCAGPHSLISDLPAGTLAPSPIFRSAERASSPKPADTDRAGNRRPSKWPKKLRAKYA